VLGNDSDLDGDTLIAILVTPPAHSAVTLNPNGSFSYRPATNYHGSDKLYLPGERWFRDQRSRHREPRRDASKQSANDWRGG